MDQFERFSTLLRISDWSGRDCRVRLLTLSHAAAFSPVVELCHLISLTVFNGLE